MAEAAREPARVHHERSRRNLLQCKSSFLHFPKSKHSRASIPDVVSCFEILNTDRSAIDESATTIPSISVSATLSARLLARLSANEPTCLRAAIEKCVYTYQMLMM